MHITEKRTAAILEALSNIHNAEWCSHYGEPGYTDPEKSIVFANWNDISKRIQTYLEEAGFAIEWSDEWYVDSNNDKAYRTSPDSYQWVCQIAPIDGDYLTPDDDVSEWLEHFAIDSPNDEIRALPSWITADMLKEQGYEPIPGTFESGLHPGQTDDPKKIAEEALKAGAEKVVFRLSESSQFYIRFEGYKCESSDHRD